MIKRLTDIEEHEAGFLAEPTGPENRADFDWFGVTVVNLMSAPGAGKTSLLERSLSRLDGVRAGVVEGDISTTRDAERIARLELPVVQVDTDATSHGEAHLDAAMVRSAAGALPLDCIDLLVIENVGDLVSPAEYDIGEHHRVVVSSVAEGEDAPLKYPAMFRFCELVVVNKTDLLPHVAFDLDAYLANLDAVHEGVPRILVSARTGDGVGQWSRWLSERVGGGTHGPEQATELAA
jgi:hydrogenase nickel incorporation protein HypB